MMADLTRRLHGVETDLGEVKMKQSALDSEQRRLRHDVQEEISGLMAKMEDFRGVMSRNHDAVMSAWEDLIKRLGELRVEHNNFHKNNGELK